MPTCPKCHSKAIVCGNCGAMQPNKRVNCYKCAQKVGDIAFGPGRGAYTNWAAVGPIKGDCDVCHSKLPKCNGCGTKNPVGKKQCKKCGAKLVDWVQKPAGYSFS
ncbi:MAG: hypothetical protein J4224_05595 [Candidatus Diapherotrites archaeon]|uniref:DZANK-type domain-containing protein n=1 Tax=Candidatus Iainarchaeum sp. TaxID=3101447 RepID=A0A7J4ISP2_9ARCH|nr:MAG: hypothetical protein QT03_C0001G0271 [archaeon GW2011_AR10]MBS3059864.1 hypothetical protein [Candidatus Diapherotrites archaeon]HIH08541.1 hypothetical protein [Candidatus Diapherotrites archaeon]